MILLKITHEERDFIKDNARKIKLIVDHGDYRSYSVGDLTIKMKYYEDDRLVLVDLEQYFPCLKVGNIYFIEESTDRMPIT